MIIPFFKNKKNSSGKLPVNSPGGVSNYNMSESLMCNMSQTNKSENQDASICLSNQYGNVFVVADGIGSFVNPKEASSIVINYIKNNIDVIKPQSTILTDCFLDMGKTLRESAKKKYGDADKENLFGTTLILGIETEDKLMFAYVGNGAILHIRGTITNFGKHDDAWYIHNLLSPHSVNQGGREALYGYLSNDRYTSGHIPTIIEISKDHTHGDIFVICTDGIYSSDHIEQYSSKNLGLLYKIDDNLIALKDSLYDFVAKKRFDNCSLDSFVFDFLSDIKPNITDDATMAILVTSDFIAKQTI